MATDLQDPSVSPRGQRAGGSVSDALQIGGDGATALRLLFVGAYVGHAHGSPAVSAAIARRLAERGAVVHTVSQRRHALLRLADVLATIARRAATTDVAHVDVFSGRAFLWAEAAVGLLRRLGVPVVCTLHGGGLPAFALAEPARVARLLRHARIVTAPSRYLREALRPLRDDVRVVPNPIDVAHFAAPVRDARRRTLLWLRALHAIYAPALALDVVDRLRRDFPDLTLRMVGPDKDGRAPALRAAIEARGLAAHVSLVGPVAPARVPHELAAADVFLNTSTVDNTPVSVLEAMAAGCCVVSTAVGGVPWLVRDGVDALLAPPGDAAALATRVARVLREPGTARALSAAAQATAARHDWNLVAPAWESLLAEAATHAPTRLGRTRPAA